jgi:hypothetical protein
MRLKTASLTLLGTVVSFGLLAQGAAAPTVAPRAAGIPGANVGTKISGTLHCQKGTSNAVEVGDEAGHALAVGKSPCTWTKPMTIGGSTTKEGTSSNLSDARGNVSSDHGYHVGTMANGDKYFVRFDGRSETNKGVLQSQIGRWGFVGGTGKLTGLQGRGTYKTSAAAADGSTNVEVEGEYRLAEPSTK